MATQKRGEKTRKALADAAIDLFEAYGFENTTVEDITRVVGVSQMTFFRNFPTRAAVFAEFSLDREWEERIVIAPLTLGARESVCWAGLRMAEGMANGEFAESARSIAVISSTPSLAATVFGPPSTLRHSIESGLKSRGVSRFEAMVAAGSVLGGVAMVLEAWAEDRGQDLVQMTKDAISVMLPDFPFEQG